MANENSSRSSIRAWRRGISGGRRIPTYALTSAMPRHVGLVYGAEKGLGYFRLSELKERQGVLGLPVK